MHKFRYPGNFLLSFLLLCLFVSCSDQAIDYTDQPVANILPLKIGNEWIFQRSYYDSLGNVTATGSGDTILIKGDTLIDGFRWFYHRYLGHYLAYRNSETGALTRLVSPNTDGRVCLAYKQPARVGDTYGFPIVFFASERAWLVDSVFTCQVVSLDTVVTISGTAFHCYQYRVRHKGSEWWYDEFLSPKNGWIRKDFYSRSKPGGGMYRVSSLEAIKILFAK